MNDSVVRIRFFILGILSMAVALCFFISQENVFAVNTNTPDLLTVAFLDVGQGDAIFIETPDGVQMLIDGGADSSVLRELPKYMPMLDKSLDVIMVTHPDKDHIGGLVDVLQRYEVKHIIRTNNQNDTAVSSAFNFMIDEEEALVSFARTGQQLMLGASTSLLILSPSGATENWESNTSSVVAQLRYGDIEFMLTGDAPKSIEEYLVKTYGDTLESEVLKLGHHGSKTSTADSFLAVVEPEYGVISAGINNSYGHPHSDVVLRATKHDVELSNTATDGTVVFKSDGKTVWRE